MSISARNFRNFMRHQWKFCEERFGYVLPMSGATGFWGFGFEWDDPVSERWPPRVWELDLLDIQSMSFGQVQSVSTLASNVCAGVLCATIPWREGEFWVMHDAVYRRNAVRAAVTFLFYCKNCPISVFYWNSGVPIWLSFLDKIPNLELFL